MTYQPIRPYGASAVTPSISVIPGDQFFRNHGERWTGIECSEFSLPKRWLEGEEIRPLVDERVGLGFNEFRMWPRVDWTGPPSSGVETGWAYDEGACELLLLDAAARGLRVELVAHTGKYADADTMANHLRRVDELCLRHENALLEVYNEPQQNGGNDLVEAILDRYTPRTPGWASGVYDQTPYTSVVVIGQTDDGKPIYGPTSHARVGVSVSLHTTRKNEWSRLFKDAYEIGTGQGPSVPFAPGFPGPVMLDEPPQVEQTIRDEAQADWSPADDWAAYGAGAAFFACGATMHGNPDFQQCVIPSDPRVVLCVESFLAGMNDVPVQRYHGYNRTDPPSSNPGARTYHRWGDDSRQYVITVRPYSFGTA